MNAEPVFPPSIPKKAQPAPKRGWGRVMVMLGIMQMFVSITLLLTAATAEWETPPRWGHVLDVGLAFSVVLTGMAIDRAAHKPIPARIWRPCYYVATYLPIIVVLALWLGRDAFDLNFLTGVAWRLWLIVHVLPSAWALWQAQSAAQERHSSAA